MVTEKKKGWIVCPDDNGINRWYEQTFPIETHHALLGWMQDFWAAFSERPKILRWIARVAMGKYAYRELYGSKEAILKSGYGIWDYSLHELDYHKDKVPT
jgi:hypothetical protein